MGEVVAAAVGDAAEAAEAAAAKRAAVPMEAVREARAVMAQT